MQTNTRHRGVIKRDQVCVDEHTDRPQASSAREAGAEGRPARDGEDLDYVGCVFFSDPDGNRWCVQQIPARD